MYVVILAGGSGTRFWPLSRQKNPKQLMSVIGGRSMLQRTVDRVLPLKPKRILIVTNTLQADETHRQLKEYQRSVKLDIIEEPVGRNTAPAIGLAASIIARYDPDGLMLVLPADHYITDEKEFQATILRGKEAAYNGYLVSMGIVPTRPETGYGYIEAEREFRGSGPYPVKRFVEKPPLEKALEYLEAGTFYWNSGMFIWRADVILDEILAHMPQLTRSLAKLTFADDIWELGDLYGQIEQIYAEIIAESIDYGVMERSNKVVLLPAEFGWSDVGSWSALPEVLPTDTADNLLINVAGDINIDSGGCLAYGNGKLVALVGVWDLIVVDSDDALLVCSKERAQDVKKVVEVLAAQKRNDYL